MNKSRIMNKLLVEHEKMETPTQEKMESKRTQTLEKTLGVERKHGGKVKKVRK